MRIRKNAKISAFLYTTTNLSTDADESLLQENLCQLNQSPWDIITFPSEDSSSSLYQFDDNEVYYNVNLSANGSSADSLEDFKSLASKTSPQGENDNDNDTNMSNNNNGENLGFKEEIVLCGKLDEKGWQCGMMVKNGNTMCDNHLSKLQKHAVWTTKKKSRQVSGPASDCRPHRAKKRPTTNPHDFYYYAGFGPSWGKKRGAQDTVPNTYIEASIVASDSRNNNVSKRDDVNDDIDVQRLEPEMLEVGPMVELDYDDDNVQKGKKVIVGKKRGRKPIKARSLKSLM